MSDFGSTQHHDKAEASRDLEIEIGIRRSQIAIRYQMVARVNGVMVEEEFECHARERENKMRILGINLDNDPWALRNMKDGRWCEPIGTDNELKQLLRRRR